jgi:GT2 family glycosyltransferase
MTQEFLDSIKQLDYDNYRMILVDDCSTDDSIYRLRQEYPWVVYLSNDRYRDFAYSMNEGIKYALYNNADFVFIVNNDTRGFPRDYIQQVLDKFDEDPDIGIVSSKVYTYDGLIEYDGTPFTGFGVEINLHGTGFVVRREVFKKIGLLDYSLGRGFEDCDFELRAKKNGYRSVYLDDVSYQHKGQGTSRYVPFYPIYYDMRNSIWFTKRYNIDKGFIWFLRFISSMIISRMRWRRTHKQVFKGLLFGIGDGLFKNWNPDIGEGI